VSAWREHAACRGKPLHLFFPAHSGGQGGANYGAEAIAICRTCPVIVDCHAAHRHEPDGIFGGTTPEQRGYRRWRAPSPISLRGGRVKENA